MPLAFAHLDSLNTEQRRAEGDYALSGPFLVIASAGSGDIGTLVQLAYLRSATLATDLTVAFPDAKGTRMN